MLRNPARAANRHHDPKRPDWGFRLTPKSRRQAPAPRGISSQLLYTSPFGDDVPGRGTECGTRLVGARLQDDRISLVTGDDAIELLQFVGTGDRDAEFFVFQRAAVVDYVAFYFRLGVIAGEAIVGVDGWWQIVNDVSRGDRDVEYVGIARGPFKFDGKLARLFCLKNAAALHPQNAGTNQQQASGVLGVFRRFKRVVEAEGLVGVVEIENRALREPKERQRAGE